MENIEITFLDGNKKQYPKNITGLEIAKSISSSLAKKSVIMLLDDQEQDIYLPIKKSAKLELITAQDERALEILRHDTAHLLAQAVKILYPETQVTIESISAIKDGFYYDFSRKTPFTPEDLPKIEKKMRQLAEQNIAIKREEWQRDEAVKFFTEQGEEYKAQIIADIPQDQLITLYRQGDFIDLCRGSHARSTNFIKHFKLTKISGAYWRGDSNNEMLQRIYGTAWLSKQDLDDYLQRLEEAAKRDHRKLGKDLDLFHIQTEAVGSIFWHKNGTIIYNLIQKFLTNILLKEDYFEVKTPLLIDRALWEKSGHWEKFSEHMFVAESENRHLALKPMNCPAHIQIFNQKLRSYRDLPLRMSEFGCCHRNEPSGALYGIMRVRSFVQDDAHIFCMEEQITSETKKFSDLLLKIYKVFGFTKVKVKFSDRPEKRAGSDAIWDKAEGSLLAAIKEVGLDYEINPGEGAFYGPKIEFVLTDAIGRDWQCGTLQVDFVLPERLDAKYVDADNKMQRPVMLHRAILGSFERFIGILIEHYAGKFPFWLAPTQIVIVTVTNKSDIYAQEVYELLKSQNIRVELDVSAEKISYKIRKYSHLKTPMIFIIGEAERANKTVQIRQIGIKEQEVLALNKISNRLKEIKDIPPVHI